MSFPRPSIFLALNLSSILVLKSTSGVSKLVPFSGVQESEVINQFFLFASLEAISKKSFSWVSKII
jgi:hypothetical protein